MKVICLKDKLKEVLFFAERNSGKSAHNPILQSVKIKTGKGILSVLSTNLETGFNAVIPAKVEKDGEVVVPVKVISQLVGGVSGDKIILESIKQNLNISSGGVSSTIKGYPVDDFPILPAVKNKFNFKIKKDDLLNGLKSVINSVSNSNIKPELSSIFFYSRDKSPLKFVATDSFRLAEKSLKDKIENFNSFLLPGLSASELVRILEYSDGEIDVGFNEDQIFFSTDNFQFISRLTEGSFPGYEQIIPRSYSTEVMVGKNEIINAIRTASLFSGNLNEVNINIIPQDELLEVRTSNGDIGEHTSQLSVKAAGDDINLNFNYSYLLDGLQNITSKDVILKFCGNDKPLMMQNIGDASYFYLAMPMKN